MSNPTRRWKRFLAVGCSHGKHLDPAARRAVLKFIADFKPQRVIHLGDFCDTAALRAGAHERDDVDSDIDAGLQFLIEIGATDVLCGNHEDRLWRLQHDRNPLVAALSGRIIREIEDHCTKHRVRLVPWDGVHQSLTLGNYTLMHGVMFGENATRDHAEAFGNVIHAHTHRPGIATGRRSDFPLGFGVGTLTRRREMDYAKGRRATLAWGQAFVYGEYCDNFCAPQLCLGPQEQQRGAVWRLP